MRFAIGAFDAVDTDINHGCPRFDPIWSHQPRDPGRRNHHVTRAGQLGQIFCEPIGTEHGGFGSHQQQRNGFSHDVGLTNHEAPHATQIHAAALQHVANRESGTRHQRTPAKDSVADVGRIDAFDIFVRINGCLDAFRFHPLRQGQKHHHGVDLGIGIEALDAGEHRGFVRILGDGVQMELNAQLLGPGPLPLGIDFGAGITLGQDGVQANLATLPGQRGHTIPQNPAFLGRQSPSINHVGHSTSHGRREDYSRTRYCVPMSTNRDLLLVSVGNTSITAAPAPGGVLEGMERIKHSPEAADRLIEIAGKLDAEATVVLAGVHAEETKRLAAELSKLAGPQLRIEDDLAAPIGRQLAEGATPGVDRLLAAAGAWSLAKQAVIIVDAGTAITVDFVDGEGTFHGGAIAPGLGLMLDALAEGTDALPSITFQSPSDDDPFGADTESAMRLGVHLAARGLISQAIERYALAYGAWPKVLATGGDAAALLDGAEIVDRVVPDLVLRGMLEAVQQAEAAEDQ